MKASVRASPKTVARPNWLGAAPSRTEYRSTFPPPAATYATPAATRVCSAEAQPPTGPSTTKAPWGVGLYTS